MVKRIIKSIFIIITILLLNQSVFGYQILIDAFVQGSNQGSVKYILNMSAYKKTVSYFNGNTESYPVPTNSYISGLSSFSGSHFNYTYSGDVKPYTVNKTSGHATRTNNWGYYNALPDFYSVGGAARIFHTKLGTNYNGSSINIGYQSYTVGASLDGVTPNIQGNGPEYDRGKATISAGPSDIGIVAYQEDTEYQFKVQDGIYYGYHEANITDAIKSNLQSIKMKWESEPAEGRLYTSASMRTKNDAYPFKPGHQSYTVNLNSAFQLLNLPKMSKSTANGGWGNTAISGIRKNNAGNDTGVYEYERSVVNMYDNVIQLGEKKIEDTTRVIYVQHLDSKNNILAEYKNTYARMVTPTGTRPTESTNPYNQYQEKYTIITGERIEIRKSDKDGTEINGKKYNFYRGTAAKGTTMALAQSAPQAFSFNSPTATFTIDESGKDDFVIVRLFYEEEVIKLTQNLNNLTLVGRLCFINQMDNSYRYATTNDNIDYVPATSGLGTIGRLTPYVNGAYPYVVRALNYEDTSRDYEANASISTSIRYYYTRWVYNHTGNPANDCEKLVCGRTEHTHTSSCYTDIKDSEGNVIGSYRSCGRTEHTHTSSCYTYHDGCGWHKSTPTSTISNTLYYSVPYQHIWYNMENLKIYRISHLEVYDDDKNVGGTLFGGGTYRVDVSTAYNRRFTNSSGLNRANISVSFPSSSYSLSTIYRTSLPMPGGGTSNSHGAVVDNQWETHSEAQADLDTQTHSVRAQNRNLTISYSYWNDYVVLDGYSTMVNRNQKSWSEPIRTATVTKRVLDSTRQFGYSSAGIDNGSKIHYTGNLNSFMRPTARLTTKSDFQDNYQTIPQTRENGIREPTGKLFYTIEQSSKYNIGADTFDATDYTYVINPLYPPAVYGKVTPADLDTQEKLYSGDDVNKVNVFSPVSVGGINLSTTQKVDHTSTGVGQNLILQKNAFFTIQATASNFNSGSYSFSDTREFIKGYYFMCSFDVEYNGEYVPQYQSIYVDGAYATFTAKTTSSVGDSAADFATNSVKVVAVTRNITDALKDYYDGMMYTTSRYLDLDRNQFRTATTQNQVGLLSRADIVADGNHAAYRIINSVNVGRLFDFAVTDCTDLAFKDVFRKTTSTNVNEPTGIAYYSGTKRWSYETSGYNDLINRTDIGTNPRRILPLGPHKHTDPSIVAAPKMGYRISFDLKTTGYMADDNRSGTRTIQIRPSYYYISKDGSVYKNNIKLFYKNSAGQYVAFQNSGYKIYFRPNDGYRYLRNSLYFNNYDLMSKELEGIDISNVITLTNKMMATNNDSFLQAWYGEFKLPNSTIAVELNGTNYDINNQLKDGYIGVIFDIRSIDNPGRTLLYNTSDKSASSTNTTQWDYEGFLGFNSPGSSFAGSLKLEKGTWNINNTVYNNIKGTVVLFDTDNRAADDFQ